MDEPNLVACLDRCSPDERVSRGTVARLSEDTSSRLAEVFRVLADPTRTHIVCCLMSDELCTCDLAEITHISEAAVSQHLRLLRERGLVRTRREGRRVYYALDDDHVQQLLSVSLSHLNHSTAVSACVATNTPADSSRSEQSAWRSRGVAGGRSR